jgi:very-short-patch-repair endonuclease
MGTDLINIEKETLYKYYVTDMLSARGIARIYHCTGTTINNKLYKYGIIQNLTEAQRLAISNKRLEERTIAKNQPKSKLKQSISMKKAYERQPELKNMARERMEKRFEDPDYKEETIAKLNAGLNASWESEEGRANRVAIRNSDEYKEKWGVSIRETWKNNPELARNLSERDKIMWQNPQYAEAVKKGLDEYWSIPENCEKQSLMMIKLWQTPEFREEVTDAIIVALSSPEVREKLSLLLLQRWSDAEYKAKMVVIHKQLAIDRPELAQKRGNAFVKLMENPDYRLGFITIMQELNRTHPELAINRGEYSKYLWENDEKYRADGLKNLFESRDRAWADPEKKAEWIKNNLKANRIRPTSIEQTIIDVCQEYSLPYKYVGNGEIIIEGKNPDFICTNGCKTILECYGRYWHQPEDEPERKEYFLRFGYKTLILWDYEIDKSSHEELRDKINNFTEEYLKEWRLQHPINEV